MKKVLITLLFLTGCSLTPYDDYAQDYISKEGKESAAQLLQSTEWYLCRAAPIGSIRDRYFGTSQWSGYLKLCRINPDDVSP